MIPPAHTLYDELLSSADSAPLSELLFGLQILAREIDHQQLEDWAKLYDTPQTSHQWKEHRSAYSVVEFMLNHNGGIHLQDRNRCDAAQAGRQGRAGA